MNPSKLTSPTSIIVSRFCAALCALSLLPFAVRADEKAAVPASSAPASSVTPVTKGQRVFTCAHSFHGFVYRMLAGMAKSAGIADHQSVGMSSIGGSRVIQHWDVADDKFGTKAALTAGKVDVLTLSPIWLPDEGIENFAKLGVEHNPDIRITVQEFWLPNDEYVPVYPLQTRKGTDHNATDLAKLREANDQYCHDIEEHVREINKRLGKEAVFVVPVGVAADALREKIVAGQAPGLKAQWDLFRDSWGHAQEPLQVLDGYCHFAVIYRRTPVGLPVPPELAKTKDLSPEDAEKLNRLLQELAWDAVSHHPLTGVQ
jgi:hypothetical protein